MSAVDIRSGFQNVTVPREFQTYTGLVTQDGLYVTERMQWGFNAAPAHFQEVMNYALNAPCVDAKGQPIPPAKHATYLDDVSTGDVDVEACWENTEVIIARLALRNLPIGIWKCTFLTRALVVVGATICSGEYQLASKSIKKLFASSLPRTLAQLQGLLGSLNFCSNFIPDYRRKIKPLLRLLHHDNDGKWTLEHTALLNELAVAVQKRLKLGIVNMQQPARLHIDVDDTDMSGVLV